MRIVLLFIVLAAVNGCDLSNDERFSPMPAEAIQGISITDKVVTINAVFSAPTPCWHYYKSETSGNDSLLILKVIARDKSEVCAAVISSFVHEEIVNFNSYGSKTIKLWQNDSTFLDTTIIL